MSIHAGKCHLANDTGESLAEAKANLAKSGRAQTSWHKLTGESPLVATIWKLRSICPTTAVMLYVEATRKALN